MMERIRAVDLQVHLPDAVADEVEEVQRTAPELFNRMLQYLMLRKTVFGMLSEQFRYQTADADR